MHKHIGITGLIPCFLAASKAVMQAEERNAHYHQVLGDQDAENGVIIISGDEDADTLAKLQEMGAKLITADEYLKGSDRPRMDNLPMRITATKFDTDIVMQDHPDGYYGQSIRNRRRQQQVKKGKRKYGYK